MADERRKYERQPVVIKLAAIEAKVEIVATCGEIGTFVYRLAPNGGQEFIRRIVDYVAVNPEDVVMRLGRADEVPRRCGTIHRSSDQCLPAPGRQRRRSGTVVAVNIVALPDNPVRMCRAQDDRLGDSSTTSPKLVGQSCTFETSPRCFISSSGAGAGAPPGRPRGGCRWALPRTAVLPAPLQPAPGGHQGRLYFENTGNS